MCGCYDESYKFLIWQTLRQTVIKPSLFVTLYIHFRIYYWATFFIQFAYFSLSCVDMSTSKFLWPPISPIFSHYIFMLQDVPSIIPIHISWHYVVNQLTNLQFLHLDPVSSYFHFKLSIFQLLHPYPCSSEYTLLSYLQYFAEYVHSLLKYRNI